jgi:hypothetical protein
MDDTVASRPQFLQITPSPKIISLDKSFDEKYVLHTLDLREIHVSNISVKK